MAKPKRNRRKAGSPTRRKAPAHKRRAPDWRTLLVWVAQTFTARRIGIGLALLAGLLVLGIGGGYFMARRLDSQDRDAKARAIIEAMKQEQQAQPPQASAPAAPKPPAAEPRYGRIEDLPDYPRYTDNTPGEQRPALEEPPRPGSTLPRSAVGAQTWRRNAVVFKDDGKRPLIAIVIDDMGLDRPRSSRAVALSPPLTLSFLPYARELREQAAAAHARGHELMLHMPMEPISAAANPGPGALLVSFDRAEILRRLQAALASFDGYVGFNNHMGSKFTADRAGMDPVLQTAKDRGLLFLDSRTTASSVGDEIAQELAVPSAVRHVFLDDVDSIDNVRAQLLETEHLARRQGFAIAIGHPHDNTLLALSQWLPTLPDKGLAQAPLTAVVIRRGRWQ